MKKMAEVQKKMLAWIIRGRAEINYLDSHLVANGFGFVADKTRMHPCKDQTLNVRFVYQKAGKEWLEQHTISIKLSFSEKITTVIHCYCDEIKAKNLQKPLRASER